jgi:hypothetical protein
MRIIDWAPLAAKDAIPIAIGFLTAAIGLWQYIRSARSEFLKPIREAQLHLYLEACSAAARVATLTPNSKEWNDAKADFLRIYYGPGPVLEDYKHDKSGARISTDKKGRPLITVERAMIVFEKCMKINDVDMAVTLPFVSLALAHACRISLGASWGFKADQLKGDYQREIEDLELWLEKRRKDAMPPSPPPSKAGSQPETPARDG